MSQLDEQGAMKFLLLILFFVPSVLAAAAEVAGVATAGTAMVTAMVTVTAGAVAKAARSRSRSRSRSRGRAQGADQDVVHAEAAAGSTEGSVTATAHLRRKDETSILLRDTIGKTSTKDYGHVDACGNRGHLVALFGDAGAGKSSLVNAVSNVLHSCNLPRSYETRHWQPPCFVGQGNGNGTGEAGFVTLADGFAMVDTRGYAEHGEGTVAEIRSIATHGIADRQNFVRNGVVSGQRSERTRLEAPRHVAALVYVHNAEMPVAAETLDSYNAAVRGNQKPVVVLTHIDRLSAEELVKARDDAMQLFGVADSHLFEVKHVTRNRETDQVEPDLPNQVELLRLVVTLLTESERFTPEKNLDTRWVVFRDWVGYQIQLSRSSTPRKLLLVTVLTTVLALILALSLAVELVPLPADLSARDGMFYLVVCGVFCVVFCTLQRFVLQPDVARPHMA